MSVPSFVRALCLIPVLVLPAVSGEPLQLTDRMHHLRSSDGPAEWSEFAQNAEGSRLQLPFEAARDDAPWCLEVRQYDIKTTWRLRINDKDLGQLHRDENDMVVYFDIPVELLQDGQNVLSIEASRSRAPDDIRVGEIRLHRSSRETLLNESAIRIRSTTPMPVRITVLNKNDSLQDTGLVSSRGVAVRPGTIYVNQKSAGTKIPVPAGRYTVYVGRGFEYSLTKLNVTATTDAETVHEVTLRREVPTEGYVACDTHVHTRTHSGHGDSTVEERMVTLAAEGIELPIATDHNVHVDHRPFADEAGVAKYFTPVIGNEVTTPVGHFNIWPVKPGTPPPVFKLNHWDDIRESIAKAGPSAVILNHARDIHSGVRPFGPKLFNDAVGERVDGWKFSANAMEVVNSSANQTDILQMFHDWMALLNRGVSVTPVGSSDSHDVARHFVGQGRTYIRCDDADPGNIDIEAAARNFTAGHVMASFGLLTELTIDGKYRSGDLAVGDGRTMKVHVRVLGPHWTQASHVWLFSNGERIREVDLSSLPVNRKSQPGVLWEDRWEMPRPQHDVHLVAIAIGPGIEESFWRTAKPYQPTSPEWTPTSLGCSGAVWIDGDGDGRQSSAHAYASKLHTSTGGDLTKLLSGLNDYDAAVAAQAAHLYRVAGKENALKLGSQEAERQIAKASDEVRTGIRKYMAAWRENQIAAAGR